MSTLEKFNYLDAKSWKEKWRLEMLWKNKKKVQLFLSLHKNLRKCKNLRPCNKLTRQCDGNLIEVNDYSFINNSRCQRIKWLFKSKIEFYVETQFYVSFYTFSWKSISVIGWKKDIRVHVFIAVFYLEIHNTIIFNNRISTLASEYRKSFLNS